MNHRNLITFVLLMIFSITIGCSSEKPKKKESKTNKVETKVEKPTQTETADVEEEVPSDPPPPEQVAKAKEIIKSVKEDVVAAIDAKKKYKAFCAACHGFDGKLAVNGAKDLTKSKTSMEEIVAQIYHGKGLMTPFKGLLKDEEIVAVAIYLETMRK